MSVFLRVDGVVLVDTETHSETPEQIVVRLYREVFGGPPDQQGLTFWAGRLKAGMTENELRLTLFSFKPQPIAPPPSGIPVQPPGQAIVRRMVKYQKDLLVEGGPGHFEWIGIDVQPGAPFEVIAKGGIVGGIGTSETRIRLVCQGIEAQDGSSGSVPSAHHAGVSTGADAVYVQVVDGGRVSVTLA